MSANTDEVLARVESGRDRLVVHLLSLYGENHRIVFAAGEVQCLRQPRTLGARFVTTEWASVPEEVKKAAQVALLLTVAAAGVLADRLNEE